MTSMEATQPSATIYPFPVGGRRGLNAERAPAKPAAEAAMPRAQAAAIGGAWYHDAAIQETKRSGER